MSQGPSQVSIRSYQVGFGDCFLLSFVYADGERHVLVDCGSTGLPQGVPKDQMLRVARDIAKRSGGKLTAVVATHRHKDHISGFAQSSSGDGSGDIIRALVPDLVLQPWTEDPDLAPDATGAALVPDKSTLKGAAAKTASLAAMQQVAGAVLREAERATFLTPDAQAKISFLGDDNLTNESAVRNLMTMGPNEYLHADRPTRLARLLPGVDVHVLGPPTVDQSAAVRKQGDYKDEYWHLAADTALHAAAGEGGKPQPLFPGHVLAQPPGDYPIGARWLIYHARAVRSDQMLQMVRALDSVMNNTSLILLFVAGGKSLLFPGDAQYENWSYALSKERYVKLLQSVDLYKVGHHGSLNATPKSLWKLFKRKSADPKTPDRLRSIMSTMPGKHGKIESRTEVPRRSLVAEIRHESNLMSTEWLGDDLYKDIVMPL